MMTSDLKPYSAYKDSGVEWIGDAPKRQRRSIRLQGYDYTRQGAYFVTICTRNRECLLGDIVEGRMHLSEAGRLAQAVWEDLPHHYPHVQIDVWVIMPNHMHGIIILTEATVGAGLKPAPTVPTRHEPAPTTATRHGLSEIVRAFKTFSARRINALHNTVGTPFWQRNYYEHVIRDESALDRIRQYIVDNPARWPEDPENPAVRGG